MPPPYIGKCLCGQATIEIGSVHEDQIVCHCLDCKYTSGSAYTTNVLAPEKDLKITGSSVKEFGMKAASGNIVTRVFCGNCGCAIAHKSPAFGDKVAVQTGTFPEFAKIPVTLELFVKDRWPVLEAIPGAAQKQTMA